MKIYLVLFTIFSLSGFTALLTPAGNTSMFYNTMIIFFDTAIIWYLLAVLDTMLSCLAVIPMFTRAFNMSAPWVSLFRGLFILRILTTLTGHNYEYIVLKSSFLGTPVIGSLALGIWIIFVFPSFKEHYLYAFRSKK